jgi:thiol-disulfide isomerase/thioredoxin
MYNVRLITITLFITIFTSSVFCQDSIFAVPLNKIIGLSGNASFLLHRLREVKDYSEYKYTLHENTQAFAIGRVYLNNYLSSFNDRNKSPEDKAKFLKYFEWQQFDTMQFFRETYLPNFISALVSIDGKIKRIKVDANSNFNFDDDKEFTVDTTEMAQSRKSTAPSYIATEVEVNCQMDSIKSSYKIPISINAFYFNKDEIIGGNKYLQTYISPNFYYSGIYNSGKDTVHITVNTQGFDTFYDKYTDVEFNYRSYNQIVEFWRIPNTFFQIGKFRYKLLRFDPKDKILYISYINKDSIGNQPGNYLKISPGLENFTGYTLLFFTGSWCKPCKPVLDSLFTLYNRKLNINIININREDGTDKLNQYLAKYKIPWQVILDKTDEQRESSYKYNYEIGGYPTLFFINPDRKILRVVVSKDNCIQLINEIETNDLKYFERN